VARLILHTYWRSSASYRVRIALTLKGLEHEPRYVNLLGGENRRPEFLALNPQGLVPVLQDGERVLTQSLAIVEYLDEVYPDPPLLPEDPAERAHVRSLAQLIACEIHPLDNLRVLEYLRDALHSDEAERSAWYRHWVEEGFETLERRLAASPHTGRYCCGERPGLADICLVPQVYNAQRYHCSLHPYPVIQRIHAACLVLPAFRAAAPEAQADAVGR
jgi:maleylacetoacetate isomerase